jgi:hypothetical protein
MTADRAGRHGALANLVELAPLPDIERDGDDVGTVCLFEPGNRDGRIEPA